MSLFGVRSLADVRALLYTLLPVLSALLVAQGVLNENQASLWGGLVTALLGPGIAFVTAGRCRHSGQPSTQCSLRAKPSWSATAWPPKGRSVCGFP